MISMSSNTPLPNGKTLFISAGPAAGKTALLTRWSAEDTLPTQYLALTAEDAEPRFFRYRLLQRWPDVQARYEQLMQDPISTSWGALLGMAINELHPEFCLLLDDFHLIEDSMLAPEMLALFRHFPAAGTLVVASRHRFPELERGLLTIWEADDPRWNERPTVSDLQRLPKHLLEKALTLGMVGEADPSPEGMELVRRNIARFTPPVVRLRPSWQEPADLASMLHDPNWDDIEAGLRAFRQRHLRTGRERDLAEILAGIPSEIRLERPYLFQLEAQLLYADEKYEAARTCYLQAIDRGQDRPLILLEAKIGLAQIAARLSDAAAFGDWVAQLGESTMTFSPLQKAMILNLRGVFHWQVADHEQARSCYLSVLEIPASGERALLYEHYRALSALHGLSHKHCFESETMLYAEQMIALTTRQDFQQDLLMSHVARLNGLILDEAFSPPLARFLEIPNEAFLCPLPVAVQFFSLLLGQRAIRLREFELAGRIFGSLTATILAHSSLDSDAGLLLAYRHLGQYERAKILYEEILRHPLLRADLRVFIQKQWALILSSHQRPQEAIALLDAELAHGSSASHDAIRLYRWFIRHQQGDAMALDEIRALLETPSGLKLWETEALLLQHLGLRDLPPVFQIHAFGDLSFSCDGQPDGVAIRKKVYLLMGHLILHPDGIEARPLAEKLFGDPSAQESLYTLAYHLRQTMKAKGMELLELTGGIYRLKWKEIAYCDLHEFEAFYDKAQSLEAHGMTAAAASFYELALLVSPAPLFENLPDDFKDERSAHDKRLEYARGYVSTYQRLAR